MLENHKILNSKVEYPLALRTFAVTLSFLSLRAYTYVRTKFSNCLPSLSTLKNWYRSVDGGPGFSTQALGALKTISKDKLIIMGILKDEMHLRKAYCNDKGKNCNTLEELANQALVFMTVGVKPLESAGSAKLENESDGQLGVKPKFKLVLGCFLVRSLNAEQSASLTKLCCENKIACGNIDLVSCAFDGLSLRFPQT